jgi:hypothetical protein
LNTTYHFRVVAANGAGTTAGSDHEFFTPNAVGLPDSRAFEQVSAPDKRPQGEVACIFPCSQLVFQAAESGNAFFYPINSGLADTDVGGAQSYLASRSPDGWNSGKVSPPSIIASVVDGLGSKPSAIRSFNDDLSCGVLESFNPLTADTPTPDIELGVTNLYRTNLDGTFTLLTPNVPTNPTIYPPRYLVAGVSPDCSRVYFQSQTNPATGQRYNFLPHDSGLYEWSNGTLSDAGALPNGAAGGAAQIGAGQGPQSSAVNSVSKDGTRFFFSATSNEGADAGKTAVFVRKNGVSVDASQTETLVAPKGAQYEIASPDGSRVFFTANYGLTSAASNGITTSDCTVSRTSVNSVKCDLYEYDVDNGKLTDLTATTAPGNTDGAVVAGVVQVSEDGSSVYFIAQGQLVAGKGNTYSQNQSSGGGNLYLSRDGELTFVAVVGGHDADTHVSLMLTKNGNNNAAWSAQATPDGQRLLFSSEANITGYNSGGVVEAYLYSADDESLVCVSCRRDGKPSLSGLGRPIQGSLGELAIGYHFPRAMSEDGSRVFFTSDDALVPGAIEGGRNLYEWERGQVYLLYATEETRAAAHILDSSASGDDVFFTSTKRLAPTDVDNSLDVYDLRVGGGFPAPAPSPIPCDPAADQCQGTPTPTPAAPSPASASFSGPGNPSNGEPKPRRCRKGTVKRHGRCVKPRHHGKRNHHKRAASHNRGGVK